MKKVLVFELNNYHTENFPLYEELLPSLLDDSVTCSYYVVPSKVAELRDVYDDVKPVAGNVWWYLMRKLKLRRLFLAKHIDAIIAREGADVIVFNSAEPEENYGIFKQLTFSGIKLTVFHNPLHKEFDKGPGEYNFVLGDQVYAHVKEQKEHIDGYFLPYFQRFPLEGISRDPDALTIAIQGWINFKRRDYPFLIEAAKELKAKGIGKIRFDIIGSMNNKGGKQLVSMVRSNGLEEYFIFHDKLDDFAFFTRVASSDYVMTLLGEAQKSYYQDKLTGSLTQSASIGVPLILSRDNADAWRLDDGNALVYDDLADLVEKLRTAKADYTRIQSAYTAHIGELIEENRRFLKRMDVRGVDA